LRFIHLSDLHIGKSVNGFSMLEEQRYAFNQIFGYVESKKADAVIIAGDVYDRPIPGVEAVKLFDWLLNQLVKRNIPIMIISGNHDSPERLNFARRLVSKRNIFINAEFDGKLRCITLRDEYGGVCFWLMPFVKPAIVSGFFPDRQIESYGDAAAAVLETARVDFSARNVLVSHQFYTPAGAALIRSESEINPIGGLDAIDAELLKDFDYAALGHLHRSQRAGRDNIRYAGSPVKYSFSEWQHQKSALLVEMREKGDVAVETLPLVPIRETREIKGQLDALISVNDISQTNREDYLRVILTDEEELVDPMGKIRSVYPNVMSLVFENTRTAVDLSSIEASADSVASLSPFDLFGEFFLDAQGSVMSGEQARIVRELLETGEDL
jgi:exonuclease SbcD